jgi:hypothetical protein
VDTTNITGCPGDASGSINVTATGGTGTLTYTLNPGGESNNTGEFTGLTADTYTIEVNDQNNCGPVDTSVTLSEPDPISIGSMDTTNITGCPGDASGSINITATGGTGTLTYTLNPGGESNNTGEFTGLTADTYTIEVNDQNNCGPVDTSVTLTEPDPISIGSMDTTNITGCPGDASGSINVAATGGTGTLTYTLDPGGESNNTGEFTGLTADTYTIEVNDQNNCGPVDTSVTLTEPDPISIGTVNSSDVTGCAGDATGSINVDASGGAGALTYTLSPGGTSNGTGEFTGLAAGTYTVDVTDANGCGPVSSGDIVIEEPAGITISSTSVQDVSCYGGTDGSISISAEGGTGTLSYTLQSEGTTNSTGEFTGLASGSYTVEVTDENGCGPVTQDFSLSQPQEILIDENSIEVTDATEPGAEDGSITLNASGGTAPLTYILNPDSLIINETGEFTGLSTGKYLVQVTDANQCGPKSTDSLEVAATGTAVNGLIGKYDLKLYPNPVKDNFKLEMSLSNRSDVRLEFINVIGHTVEEQKYTRINGPLRKTIDVSSMDAGMYFIRFYIGGEYRGHKTIMIEK